MQIEEICLQKEQQLIDKYFGRLVEEAAIHRPETIEDYPIDLPLKIEAEYREFLEELWPQYAPAELKNQPLVLEEKKLRELLTLDDNELIAHAYKRATTRTLKERITRSNHADVIHYKGLLLEHTRELLPVMRHDFLEEITGRHIRNKAFTPD